MWGGQMNLAMPWELHEHWLWAQFQLSDRYSPPRTSVLTIQLNSRSSGTLLEAIVLFSWDRRALETVTKRISAPLSVFP